MRYGVTEAADATRNSIASRRKQTLSIRKLLMIWSSRLPCQERNSQKPPFFIQCSDSKHQDPA